FDKEFSEEQDKYNIDKDESKILKEIKIIMPYLYEIGVLNESDDNIKKILDLRRFAKISNLINIANLPHYGAYRMQLKTNINVNPYVLYIWQCACEYIAKQIKIENEVNYDLLKEKIPYIQSLMFSDPQNIEGELQKVFSECGIVFRIVKYFKGAPVQGFIKKSSLSNNIILCMTFRQKRADVFWFSLFHEIGHIINKDENNYLVDFDSARGDIEVEADNFANKVLIDQNDYKKFVKDDIFTLPAIKKFAKTQNVQPYIVIGRLQHDGLIDWNKYVDEIPKYNFIEE
ncbi:XRE family transcriptional regulator, partial [bacterium]|nr:XRE family transcriptional regulator [bacterium]